MANSIDPDQTPHSAVSDLGLHCLLRPVWLLRVITVFYNAEIRNHHNFLFLKYQIIDVAFLALDETLFATKWCWYFSYFSIKMYVVSTH